MTTGIPSSVSLDDSLASASIPKHIEKMTNVGVNPSSTSPTHEQSDEPRRSKRDRIVKDFGSDFVIQDIEDDLVTFKGAWLLQKLSNGRNLLKVRWTSLLLMEQVYLLIFLRGVLQLSMDMETAFLYGELEEEIYMDQLEGFVAHGNEQKVCKLVKSL
ncbi:UNVERIFIED_CONTAM: Retrovirus-related Pol polyprotein from transposon TNT 1-94 [Sesamum radiatum]|uniref:Retrovirus-related Pol polyprotein from transposon TNT 1-94 n=1 Tax=Sesamum radiatum TaxID=300843 RepID=A0AAW2Q088_SESRA